MCFEHIGPQDKPMPGFCVSGPDDAGRPRALHLDGVVWRRLASLVRQEARPQLEQGRVSATGLSPDEEQMLQRLRARLAS